ncbi:MAG: hypothetical protein WBX15_05075 [Thermoanaerobaculia bacterium]
MRKVALALVVALLLPAGARALDSRDVEALVAMPLAVAAVSQLSGVPTSDLVNVVTAMNQANVPPPQFVEVVRYVPVALVQQPQPFVDYVTQQVDNGVTGDQLAVALANQIRTSYGVTRINVVTPPEAVYVVDQSSFVPSVVTTRLRPVNLTDLVAMPLAVAAVSRLTGMPANDLVGLASALDNAYVPPAQFVEIVRYAPAVLVDPQIAPQFVPYVTTQIREGVVGMPLARSIEDQYRRWGVTNVDVVNPQVQVVDRQVVLPQVVTTRVAQASGNPFGGPPGQLKKERGLQTGAEVVHGVKPGAKEMGRPERGSNGDHGRRAVARPPVREQRPAKIVRRPHGRTEAERGGGHRMSRPHPPAKRPSNPGHHQQLREAPSPRPQMNPGAAAAPHGRGAENSARPHPAKGKGHGKGH